MILIYDNGEAYADHKVLFLETPQIEATAPQWVDFANAMPSPSLGFVLGYCPHIEWLRTPDGARVSLWCHISWWQLDNDGQWYRKMVPLVRHHGVDIVSHLVVACRQQALGTAGLSPKAPALWHLDNIIRRLEDL